MIKNLKSITDNQIQIIFRLFISGANMTCGIYSAIIVQNSYVKTLVLISILLAIFQGIGGASSMRYFNIIRKRGGKSVFTHIESIIIHSSTICLTLLLFGSLLLDDLAEISYSSAVVVSIAAPYLTIQRYIIALSNRNLYLQASLAVFASTMFCVVLKDNLDPILIQTSSMASLCLVVWVHRFPHLKLGSSIVKFPRFTKTARRYASIEISSVIYTISDQFVFYLLASTSVLSTFLILQRSASYLSAIFGFYASYYHFKYISLRKEFLVNDFAEISFRNLIVSSVSAMILTIIYFTESYISDYSDVDNIIISLKTLLVIFCFFQVLSAMTHALVLTFKLDASISKLITLTMIGFSLLGVLFSLIYQSLIMVIIFKAAYMIILFSIEQRYLKRALT